MYKTCRKEHQWRKQNQCLLLSVTFIAGETRILVLLVVTEYTMEDTDLRVIFLLMNLMIYNILTLHVIWYVIFDTDIHKQCR